MDNVNGGTRHSEGPRAHARMQKASMGKPTTLMDKVDLEVVAVHAVLVFPFEVPLMPIDRLASVLPPHDCDPISDGQQDRLDIALLHDHLVHFLDGFGRVGE